MSVDRITSPVARRVLLVLSVAVLAWGGVLKADTPQITSIWRNHPIVIDGINAEWSALDELDKGPAVAVANDENFLYVIVASSDAGVRRQLATGLILWFDPSGGKKQTFAIGIPGTIAPGAALNTNPAPDDSAIQSSASTIDQFDIYGPGKNERHLIRMDPAFAIEMASNEREGTLAYELKIPLMKDDAKLYAVGAGPGSTVGFGIATPEAPTMPVQRSSAGGTGGGGTGGGGFGGMGMGGRGGRGGGMGRGGGSRTQSGQSQIKPLKIWTVLHLAKLPT